MAIVETVIFPYYVAKDMIVRDRYRAKVVYDAEGIAIRETTSRSRTL